MKLTINTAKLQSMVAKSVKGASCNKMIPITSMMAIEQRNGFLSLITTDANNYLIVRTAVDKKDSEEFYATVPAILFSQLISKLSCEAVTIVFDKGEFTVYGNGEYKIELPLDENGEFIKYPAPYEDMLKAESVGELTLDSVKSILTANKAAVATTLEVPCYTGYYVADRIITTDTYKLCGNNIAVLKEPALIATETMDLLDVMTDAKIKVAIKDDKVLFSSDECIVYGNLMSDIDDFQVDAIKGLLDDTFDAKCKVARNAVLEALDRIGLFVSPYDNHAIHMSFINAGIELSSQQSHSTELIDYEEYDAKENFVCDINIEMLEAQVKAQVDDIITIEFGKPNAIKLINADGSIVQIIALEA